MNSETDIRADLGRTEMKFKRACDQVVLLNNKLEGLQRRYDMVKEKNLRSFRYRIRLVMATVEGIRNCYYEYACQTAERIGELREEVYRLEYDSSDEDSDFDWDSDGFSNSDVDVDSDSDLDTSESDSMEY